MTKLTAAQIRQGFIEFFTARGHQRVPSSSVLPEDPTLLFTNAGMNQFKDVFLGTGKRDYLRCVNSQKCIRAGGKHNDLGDVGLDTYHQTFFEMLGNWSFGDYYKEEAIAWAWELLTDVWGLPGDKLYATVFRTDDESAELWPKVTGIAAERVLRFDERDNFWQMAETGPCGPCSEIHIDRGPGICPDENKPGHTCAVNADCARYIELWNLVFIQHNKDKQGTLHDLPARHVDTGMGLERVVSVIQGVTSNYDTDLFTPIIRQIETLTGKRYEQEAADNVAFRAIADHVRCLAVSIADGIMPGSKDQGYVLRRILRRAARFGRQLGLDQPFVHTLVPAVVEVLGGAFPEVAQRAERAARTIRSEEELFEKTIDRGIKLFAEVAGKGGPQISGEDAWLLHGTYGFPVDLTEQMAAERGLGVDLAAFETIKASQVSGPADGPKIIQIAEAVRVETASEFVGYSETVCEATVLESSVELGYVVLDRTPFYAESGGQVGDSGTISGDGFVFQVQETHKHGQVWLHLGQGDAPVGASARAAIDVERRERIHKNHTGTHLLHWALRDRLGADATQQGSLVAPDRLRFDFASSEPLCAEDLSLIETRINAQIVADFPVETYQTSLAEAKAQGAMALFGEKYGETVRVVQIDEFSRELCGGTHVARTGEIGPLRIVSEGPVQAGVRRIVAVTGMDAVAHNLDERALLRAAQQAVKANHASELPERIGALQQRVRELEKQLESIRAKQAAASASDALSDATEIDGVRVVCARVDSTSKGALRQMGDQVKADEAAVIGFFVSADKGKLSYLAAASPAAVKRGLKAGDILRGVGKKIGGGGGGRPDMAQGGGGDASSLDTALEEARRLIAESLS